MWQHYHTIYIIGGFNKYIQQTLCHIPVILIQTLVNANVAITYYYQCCWQVPGNYYCLIITYHLVMLG